MFSFFKITFSGVLTNGAAVNQGREHPQPISECRPYGRHAYDEMDARTHSCHVLSEDIDFRRRYSLSLAVHPLTNAHVAAARRRHDTETKNVRISG